MTTIPNRPNAPVIFTVAGQHLVMLPDGSVLQGILKTVVTDEVNESPRATIEVIVNLATDVEAAKNIVESYKEQ